MYVDQAEISLDLSRPSMEALSYILRHPEEWPPGFVWHFGSCASCAMGLARQLWAEHQRWVGHETAYVQTAKLIDMPYHEAYRIFIGLHVSNFRQTYGGKSPAEVMPSDVADKIDRYLHGRF